MISAGIDIGSRTTKLVIVENGQPCDWSLRPTGVDPIGAARALIGGRSFENLVATGYGRHLARENLGAGVLTEIKACAIGAHYLRPDCGGAVDIGGQDTKVIALRGDGGIGDFVMNDRCAAGTGRFLEFMAQTLGYSVEEFGEVACSVDESPALNSMCVVFAESEVISLIARGETPARIARAIHQSMADRISSLARGIRLPEAPIFLAGGVSRNPCIRMLLEKRLGHSLCVHDHSQYTPALGAAIIAGSGGGGSI